MTTRRRFIARLLASAAAPALPAPAPAFTQAEFGQAFAITDAIMPDYFPIPFDQNPGRWVLWSAPEDISDWSPSIGSHLHQMQAFSDRALVLLFNGDDTT